MMKHFKRWIISCGLLLAALLTAGPVFASDITMVTYFPVPYAAYDNLYMQTPDPDNVTPRFTVGGKSDKEFTLNLNGQTADDGTQHPSLKVVSGAVAKLNAPCADIVNDDARNTCLAAVGSSAVNKLQFDTDILTTGTATFGNTGTLGEATMNFESDLRINNQLGGDGAVDSNKPPLQEIHATNLNVDGTMNMITDSFETNAAALPGCTGTVSWNKLKFNTQESWFLTCGDAPTTGSGEGCVNGYKWEFIPTGGTCFAPANCYKQAYINSTSHTSTEVLDKVLHCSKCDTVVGKWDANAGHPYYDPIDAVFHNSSTWCTAGGVEAHNPGQGKFCLDVGIATTGNEGSTYHIPACGEVGLDGSGQPYPTDDFSGAVNCEAGDITWYSGPSTADDGRDANPVRLYRAVCKD